MDTTPPSRLLGGRYRLQRVIGHGGMSDVHVARDEVLGRDVAVKLLSPDRVDGAGGVERLEREARATAGLSHPNVVVVHDVLRDGPDAAIVMELVTGETLADRLRRAGPMPWTEAVETAEQVASGLAAAHARGLVHRDVKPSNVLLGDDGQVKVADFGIAGSREASTQTTTVRGSVPYLAPEQARGQRPDPRTDVYALGCVLHELLTGQPPFSDDTDAAIIGQHLHRQPTGPGERVADVPAALDALVLRMLAKEPSDRHPDMAAVLADLGHVRAGGHADTAVLPVPGPGGDTTPTRPVDPPRPRRATPVLLGLGGALAALVLVLAWRSLAPDRTSAGPPDPSVATTAPTAGPTTTAPSPSPPGERGPPERPETVQEAAAAFRRELVAGRADGRASAKAVEELDKAITEILEKHRDDDRDDVRTKVRELDDRIAELVEKGELDAALAETLADAARDLRQVT